MIYIINPKRLIDIIKSKKAEPIGAVSKDHKRKKVAKDKWVEIKPEKQLKNETYQDKELLDLRSFKISKNGISYTVAYYPIKEIGLTPEKGKKIMIDRKQFLTDLNNGDYKAITLPLPSKDFTKENTIKCQNKILDSIEQNRITSFNSLNKNISIKITPKYLATKNIYRYNVDYFKGKEHIGSLASQSQKSYKEAFIGLKRMLSQTKDLDLTKYFNSILSL